MCAKQESTQSPNSESGDEQPSVDAFFLPRWKVELGGVVYSSEEDYRTAMASLSAGTTARRAKRNTSRLRKHTGAAKRTRTGKAKS